MVKVSSKVIGITLSSLLTSIGGSGKLKDKSDKSNNKIVLHCYDKYLHHVNVELLDRVQSSSVSLYFLF